VKGRGYALLAGKTGALEFTRGSWNFECRGNIR
jgi:hypothetical protein